jgi:hypothetical protein
LLGQERRWKNGSEETGDGCDKGGEKMESRFASANEGRHGIPLCEPAGN